MLIHYRVVRVSSAPVFSVTFLLWSCRLQLQLFSFFVKSPHISVDARFLPRIVRHFISFARREVDRSTLSINTVIKLISVLESDPLQKHISFQLLDMSPSAAATSDRFFRKALDDLTFNNVGQVKVLHKAVLPVQYDEKFFKDAVESGEISKMGM
jgi:hypothetical protein